MTWHLQLEYDADSNRIWHNLWLKRGGGGGEQDG